VTAVVNGSQAVTVLIVYVVLLALIAGITFLRQDVK
jgi:hypothetical protein